jgi:hypothetical protein
VAGLLASQAPAGAPVREVAGTLVAPRRALARNSPGGSGTVAGLRAIGLALGAGTLLLGLVRFEQPSRMVDLLAALGLAWLVGWVMGPIVVRGAGVGLRPEWFALSPLPPRRLAAGLLGASLVGFAPAVTLVAFAALVVAATRLGVVPVLVAVPATLPQLGLVVGSSRVVVTALAATLSSRRGQELGGLLMAVTIALASGGWSLAAVLGQQLATGPSSALATALGMLPSGWAPVAAALGRLAALCGLLPAAWARLLPAVMRRPAGRAPRTARRGRAAGDDGKATTGPRPGVWPRLVPAGPTGAVVAKELHTWRRDPGRTLLLLLALLISGLSLAVPAVAFDLPAALPWVGPATALIIAMGAANLYGEEGTALWLTRMIPGERTGRCARPTGRLAAGGHPGDGGADRRPHRPQRPGLGLALGAGRRPGHPRRHRRPDDVAVGDPAGPPEGPPPARRPLRHRRGPQRRRRPDRPPVPDAGAGRPHRRARRHPGPPRHPATPAGPAGSGRPGRGGHRRPAVLVRRPPRRRAPGRPRRRAAGPAPPRPPGNRPTPA